MNKNKVLIGIGVLALLFLFLRKKKAVVVEEEVPQEEGGAPSGGGGGGGSAPSGAEKSLVVAEMPVGVTPIIPLGIGGTNTQNISQTTNINPAPSLAIRPTTPTEKPLASRPAAATIRPMVSPVGSRPANATTRPIAAPVVSAPVSAPTSAAKFSDFSYVDGGQSDMLDSLL